MYFILYRSGEFGIQTIRRVSYTVIQLNTFNRIVRFFTVIRITGSFNVKSLSWAEFTQFGVTILIICFYGKPKNKRKQKLKNKN